MIALALQATANLTIGLATFRFFGQTFAGECCATDPIVSAVPFLATPLATKRNFPTECG